MTLLEDAEIEYLSTDMQLVIPRIGVESEIVGVPVLDGDWDVSWLGDRVGLLEGSAFPTWPGNAVITGHVWTSYNQPGVFAGLRQLGFGDRIEIRAWGQTYVFSVWAIDLVDAGDVSAMNAIDEYSWVTLVTCEGYDEATGDYAYRRVVSAVLVDVLSQ